jgi:outer membrane lipoprotein-sorting protein
VQGREFARKIVGVPLAALWLVLALPPAQAQSGPPAAPSSPLPVTSGLPPAWTGFERAWRSISGYTATVTVFERRGDEVQNVAFDYAFHKPSSAMVHVLEGPNAGVTLVWNGGSTVVAHRGSGLAALFKKTLSLHDRLVTTIRGSSIDQLSYAAILAHAHDTAGPLSQAVGPIIGGIPTTAVTLVPATSSTDTGLTREIVDISTTTDLPVRVIGYDQATLVRQIDFSDVRPER